MTHDVVTTKILVMPSPNLGIPITPGPMPTLPPVSVTTLEDARLYVEVCEAWLSVNEPDMQTAEDIIKEYGPSFTKEASCSWALYGWPAESQLDFEKILAIWAGYTVKLRERIAFLVAQLKNRQLAIEKFNKSRRNSYGI